MVNPYNEEEPKVEQVQRMFNSIAPTYDRLNRIISLGLDKRWRRYGIELLQPYEPQHILDIATGTGDLAIDLIHMLPSATRVLGVDISEEMMRIGRNKVHSMGIEDRVTFAREDCTALTFADESFDAATIGFGIRNFADIPTAAGELYRVLRTGAPLMIIELTEPTNPVLRLGYKFYAGHIIPTIGRMISEDNDAYSYLPRSIAAVPQREQMVELLREAGFSEAYYRTLCPGTCAIYVAIK